MVTLLSALLVAIFTTLALFHVSWALGARMATGVIPEVGGKAAFSPSTFTSLVVAALLFACAFLIAAVAGWVSLPVPEAWLKWASYALAFAFFARAIGEFRLVGFFKKIRGTTFARRDTLFYSPLCLGLAAGVLIVAMQRFP